jgi:predicted metal-dependent phosphoesterase TrpH
LIFDMHIHTIVSSPCSSIDPVECVEAAIARGLDGICITEHGALEGARVVKEIAAGYNNLIVLAGIEVLSREGHLLVYGFDEDIPGVPDATEVIRIVEENGGIVAPAHPWRAPFGWYSGTLDKPLEETKFPALFKIIEKFNGLSSPKQNQKGELYCEKTGTHGIGGSDAHNVKDIGCCTTFFEDIITDERRLVAALRAGRFKAKMNESYFEAWGG